MRTAEKPYHPLRDTGSRHHMLLASSANLLKRKKFGESVIGDIMT
jgi:hypothetical protein